jgi:hypothetical protein
MNEMEGACGTYGVEDRSIQSLGEGKPEGRKLLRRHRRILEDNIKINTKVSWFNVQSAYPGGRAV